MVNTNEPITLRFLFHTSQSALLVSIAIVIWKDRKEVNYTSMFSFLLEGTVLIGHPQKLKH